MDNTKTDNELMEEFKNCSKAAYIKVFHRYKSKLLNFTMRSFSLDKDLAEEVVQQSLIKVYMYKYNYKPVFCFSTWIYTVARNYALTELRGISKKLKRTEELEPDLIDSKVRDKSESGVAERTETGEIIEMLLGKLPENYREIIVLRYIQALPFEEIAKVTGKNINTVKSLCKRGLQRLKTLSEEYE